MASIDVWSDFDSVRHSVKSYKVDGLKDIVRGLCEACNLHLRKTGNKQELIDRIQSTMDTFRRTNQTDQWSRAKQVMDQMHRYGGYDRSRLTTTNTQTVPSATYHGLTNPPSTSTIRVPPPNPNLRDPFAPQQPRLLPQTKSDIEFTPSPFFAVEQAISNVVECPESSSATDRRQQYLLFTLTPEVISKLKQPNNYQIRLYCTSSSFHPSHARNNGAPVPIEFPPTCEVRVNGTAINANLKGMKKKPGTAPPADITPYIKMANHPTRVEMVYVNSQAAPAVPKKYYLLVNLIQATSVDQLVDRLKKGKYRSAADIRAQMLSSLNDDDDIISGPQKMTLRCPLTFMRVKTPARSALCVHPQCFDATSWLMQNEQTSHWVCPVCDNILKYGDIIVDGYFDQILKDTPEEVEDVMVEANGEWHTTDNKYASPEWRAQHPPAAESSKTVKQETPAPQSPTESDNKGKGKEIVLLDSDDEDEGRVKRELSPSNVSSGSLQRQQSATWPPSSQVSRQPSMSAANIIDLTLSDDDEPAPTPSQARVKPTPRPEPPRVNQQREALRIEVPRIEKRKAPSPHVDVSGNSEVWKKARMGGQPIQNGVNVPTQFSSVYTTGGAPNGTTSNYYSQGPVPHYVQPRMTMPPVPYYPGGYPVTNTNDGRTAPFNANFQPNGVNGYRRP